jgi:hypothetical protein
LSKYRAEGGCDFSHMVCPSNFGALTFNNEEFADTAIFRDVNCIGLVLNGSRFNRGLVVEISDPLVSLSLDGSTIAGDLTLNVTVPNEITLTQATVEGRIDITTRGALELRLLGGTFDGRIRIVAPTFRGHWNNAAINGGLVLRTHVDTRGWYVSDTTFRGVLDLSSCHFSADLDLRGATFQWCALDLSRSHISGSLALVGHQNLPDEISLEGVVVERGVQLNAEFRSVAPRLIARHERPRLTGEVAFVNVDLSECLLVGNALQQMTFSRVIWPTRAGRYLLFDETVEKQQRIPLDSLKEAYQILKQKSQEAGDHAHAGDFHFGELEMRRHAWGALGSLFCLEFLYWLLSGYSTRPRRAFVAFGLLTVTAACLYWAVGQSGVSTFSDALRFSLAVSTLQKREAITVGSWIQVIQTVLAAIILALLVLAVRLRVKR